MPVLRINLIQNHYYVFSALQREYIRYLYIQFLEISKYAYYIPSNDYVDKDDIYIYIY